MLSLFIAVPLAAASKSFLNGPIGIVIVVLFVIAAIVITIRRLRKGGPGPSVGWVPKRWRAGLNRKFEDEGYQKPYDDNGNRNPDRDKY